MNRSSITCWGALAAVTLAAISGCHRESCSTSTFNPFGLKPQFDPRQAPLRIGVLCETAGRYAPRSEEQLVCAQPLDPLRLRLEQELNTPVQIMELEPFQLVAHLQSGRVSLAMLSAAEYEALTSEYGEVGRVIAVSQAVGPQDVMVTGIAASLFGMFWGLAVMTTDIAPGDHQREIKSSADGSAQPYRLYVPGAAKEDKALPLLVVLHGKGVDHNAWFDLTPVKEVAERRGYIVAAPNGRGEKYYDGAGEQDVLDIIAEVKRACRVDEDRVYLLGHSMGGWGTWYIGGRHPEVFASICPMAALAPISVLPGTRKLAPFIIHDTGDDVVPIEQSRAAAHRLLDLGISFQYREESGYGHSSKLIGDNLPRILDWFEQHPRSK